MDSKKSNQKSGAIKCAMASAGLFGLGMVLCEPALAVNVGQVASNMTTSTQGVTQAIGAFSYAAGVAFGALAAFKLKAHSDNPQQTPLGTPMKLLGVAALLLFLPQVFQTGADTIWGDGNRTSQGANGSGINNF